MEHEHEQHHVEFTLSLLSRIDKEVSPIGRATTCTEPHPDVDVHDDMLRAHGWVGYANLPPFNFRRPYERSLWLRRDDGRCAPEIYVLSILRFGTLTRAPFWTDGNWLNNFITNVSVKNHSESDDTRTLGKYGVRAATPEYRKKYYSDPLNKARQRDAARRYEARKREERKRAKDALEIPDGRKGPDDDRGFGGVLTVEQIEQAIRDVLAKKEREALEKKELQDAISSSPLPPLFDVTKEDE